MATTLVERVRQVVAVEDDDFFKAETILYYINKAQRKVTSYMIQKEKTSPAMSLRALDNIRAIADSGQITATAKDNYYQADINFPSDLLDVANLRYDSRTLLRELTATRLYMLEWGNLTPTQFESYYYVTKVSSNKTFRVFLHENPATNKRINIFYFKEPTDLTLTATQLVDLPEQLENAVIYGAAVMMITQESVRDPEGNINVISQTYQEELQANAY
jgi:hypothetical protein